MNMMLEMAQLLRLPCSSSSSSSICLSSNPLPNPALHLSPHSSFSRHSLSVSPSKSSHLPLHRRGCGLLPVLSASGSSAVLTTETPPAESDAEDISNTRLLAQNVPWDSSPGEIRALFENHGKVVDVELSMYNKTRNRGLAFVEMGSPEEAAEALNQLDGFEFEGRVLKLNYARTKKQKPSPPAKPRPPLLFNLFVANLPYEARDKDLKELFASNGGRVVSAEVVYHDNPRRSSGYGFVSFATKKEADAALSTFGGKELMGRSIRVARSKRFVEVNEGESSSQSEEGVSDEIVPNTV
ncbi:hypothetical protein Dimus_006190 [Dionaea muscipula]